MPAGLLAEMPPGRAVKPWPGARRVRERRCLPGVGDPGSRPAAGYAREQPGELAFRRRVAGLHAEPVRGYRRVIDGAGLSYRIITLPAGGDAGRPERVFEQCVV